jgi:hypothetical protein
MYFGLLIDGATVLLGSAFFKRYALEGSRIVDLVTRQSIGSPDFPVLDTEPLRRLRDLKS